MSGISIAIQEDDPDRRRLFCGFQTVDPPGRRYSEPLHIGNGPPKWLPMHRRDGTWWGDYATTHPHPFRTIEDAQLVLGVLREQHAALADRLILVDTITGAPIEVDA